MPDLILEHLLLTISLLAVGLTALTWLSGIVRFIPNNRVGVVEKLMGSASVRSGLIALHGEAGFQPEVLRGGVHWFMPFQYRVHRVSLVTITQGKIGYVFARDGIALEPDQTLAKNTGARDFQNVRGFIESGGQRGPQRQILREGTYAMNLAQFVVITEDEVLYLPLNAREDAVFQDMAKHIGRRGGFDPVMVGGQEDVIGIVTVHDGPSLGDGEIIAPSVGENPLTPSTDHNNFQDPERFLAAGGRRGRQLRVLVEGTYYINRLFASVEFVHKTVVDVGFVGVDVSYTGEKGHDLSGAGYSHGEMVEVGKRGIWSSPLLPGKYAFNTYAGQVVMVPTTNIILKWIKTEVGTHRLDESLAEVSLITKDAFEPSLPLSVVIHIDYRMAPLVVQRFGDIKRLVEQTLDPMVSAYFKNIGQTRTLIQLLQDRSQIQTQAGEEMKAKFARYNLELEEVLIGTPTSSSDDAEIEQILKQLRARQIAEEQVETYSQQEKAAVKERELREAESRAKVQRQITESELSITIQGNEGKASYQRSVQQAEQIRTIAQAEADKVRLMAAGEAERVQVLGAAEADRSARVGLAQALATEEQVRAYGGPRLQLTHQVMTRFAEAIQAAHIDIVPRILMTGSQTGDGRSGGNAFEALLATLLSDRIGDAAGSSAPLDPALAAYRSRMRDSLVAGLQVEVKGA